MLDPKLFPLYLYFKNGNTYSGSEGGMRYYIAGGKRADPEDETGKKKLPFLKAAVWPEPWSVENTDPAKVTEKEFEPGQDGLNQAEQWLVEQYHTRPEDWAEIPSILDCEPYTPPEHEEETEK